MGEAERGAVGLGAGGDAGEGGEAPPGVHPQVEGGQESGQVTQGVVAARRHGGVPAVPLGDELEEIVPFAAAHGELGRRMGLRPAGGETGELGLGA